MKYKGLRTSKFIYGNLLFAAIGLPALPVTAQEVGFEEIVVTAQQREENLQDVPISISAFTSEAIEKAMFSDVSEYITRTPNASFITTGAKSRREISIRGVTNFLTASTALRSSTFGFYIDEFSVAGSSINPPIMDIERIEILRGPQATYFGRNAIGGGISITSKKPGNELSGSVSVDYSSYDTVDIEGVVNLPIVEDKLAVRLNGKYYHSDGHIKNINPLGGGNNADYKYIKGSIRFTPNDNLTIDVSGSYADEEVGMREGVPSGVFSTFAGGVLYAGFPDLDGDGLADPTPDGIGFYPENRNLANYNSPQEVGTNFKYVVGKIQYDWDELSLTSITGYIKSDFFLRGDIDGGSGDYFNEFRTVPRSSFSQEFRLQNSGDGPLLWNVGVLYAKDKGRTENRTFVGAAEPFGLPDGFLIDRGDEEGSARYLAAFGQLDWSITDKLTMSVGGRYSAEQIKSDVNGFSGVTVTVVSIDETFNDFSPRFALSYEASDDMTLYATASKGFKSGGVQVSPFPGAESYEPESIWNYEIGLKADMFEKRLRLSAAAFHMDWKDMQTAFQQAGTDADGNLILFGGIENAEKAVSKGFELTAAAIVSEGLVLNFSAGYLNAKYKKFVSFIDGENRVLDNRTIPSSPKWTLAADAEYTFDVGANHEGYIRAEWTYRDDIRASNRALISDGFPWEVPSYDFVNLRAGIQNDKYSVVLYAENLFDSVYYTNAYQKAFTGGLHIEPSYRRFGVRLTYSFH